MLRALSIVAGVLIIGAATVAVILNAGGFTLIIAPLPIAAAVGLVVGSAIVGQCTRDARVLLATGLTVALFSGEAYAMLATGETVIRQRDALSEPIESAQRIRRAAEQRVKDAITAKADADDSAISQAALPGCRKECSKLLTDAKNETAQELANARAALASLPPDKSASPLADKLGVDPGRLDLFMAGLRALGVNGLGAFLIAFGAHGRSEKPEPEAKPVTTMAASVRHPASQRSMIKFVMERLTPCQGGRAALDEAYLSYREWCLAHDEEVFSEEEFADVLRGWCNKAKLTVRTRAGRIYMHGISLTSDVPFLTSKSSGDFLADPSSSRCRDSHALSRNLIA